ncbi:MAG: D-alanyl-D-alanine carboxypeptidase [Magnetococcales bacterium]|nr:D-alanyl-D-alanine carboxypeptidase [Magnetococcales bacterium]
MGAIVLALLLVVLPLAGWAAEAPLSIRGKAGILGDIDSGTVLFEHNADVRLEPASLTKVMTLYLIYEALAKGDLTLETRLPVSEKAWRVGGSKTFVKVGDQVRLEDLILGIAVQSGNDACMVVAEYLGGSVEGFALMMNTKAKSLGMNGTHFVNSSGLPDPDHYTTARDLFTLAKALMSHFPQYSHYSREKQYTYNGIRQHNRNRLLWQDPSVTGLKTGHTQDAGYCLIATYEKDSQRLAAVVLGADRREHREADALMLLRYGNRFYETVKLFEAGAVVRTMRVWKGAVSEVKAVVKEALAVTVLRKERSSLEVGLLYDEPIVAPLKAGDPLGSVVVKLANKEVRKVPVVAEVEVPESGIIGRTMDSLRLFMGW